MAQAARNIDRLSEAMQTLEELASQERAEVRELLSTQIGSLKKAFREMEPEVRQTLRNASERISQFATVTAQATKEKMKDIGQNVDMKAHEKPWAFVGASAIAGALAGYYLGHRLSGRD